MKTMEYQTTYQEETEKISSLKAISISVEVCLVCGSKISLHQTETDNGHFLSKNFSVIFLMRNLLQLPVGQVEWNLKDFGNPENWITLCENCSELTRKGEKLYQKIVKINKELKLIRNKIVNKIRSDHYNDENVFKIDSDCDCDNVMTKRQKIGRETRDFVTNYDYKDSIDVDVGNRFVEGDKQAEILKPVTLTPGNHSNSHSDIFREPASKLIKQEKYHFNESGDIEDGQNELDCWDNDWQPGNIVRKPASSTANRKAYRKAIVIDGKHKCHHCDKLFNSRQQCHIHEQKIHSSLLPGRFPCDICDQVKNSVSLLTQHKRIVHKMKADGTRVKMKTMSMVKGPWKNIVLKDDKWTCILCNKKYTTKMSCYGHVMDKHEKTGHFICDICGMTSISERNLYLHKRKIHQINLNGTPITTIITHKSRKPKAKVPQTCQTCGKIYASESSLHNHVRFVHEKRLKCFCHLCGMGFYSSPALERHLLSMHKEDEQTKRRMEEGARIWKCEVVGYVVQSL